MCLGCMVARKYLQMHKKVVSPASMQVNKYGPLEWVSYASISSIISYCDTALLFKAEVKKIHCIFSSR